ncbi:MAG TPA: alpha-1,4-glucan--maltose-1-phosphate maltosyltransferase [Actinomycetota bacterium]|nr:alpha-1,4-glucan--maltose-1-phosphate maltosyltransferase [Actinomycetota bacterium]
MQTKLKQGPIRIEEVSPQVDCAAYPAKTVVGDDVAVSAAIFRDGHDLLRAVVRYRAEDGGRWAEAPMSAEPNDVWTATFSPSSVGRWVYTIEAWTDHFGTWRRDAMKKLEAGQDLDVEIEEGALIVEGALAKMPPAARKKAAAVAVAARSADRNAPTHTRIAPLFDEELAALMQKHAPRDGSTTLKPLLGLTVDRERARTGAWYELFPRSTGSPGKHGTFATAIDALPRIAEMGFDVVYLPPIHPIGRSFRKGPNNTLEAGSGDVGSPWAIGGPEGGHTDVHPDLGTLTDFDRFVRAADKLGIEVALDFAIQCSPEHPWVTEHPEWFHHRPDGTIKYAENPPKKYQDIYPVNFDTEDREGLWGALKEVVDHWIEHGVRIFRVDNPHTKPLPFWEWLIGSVHDEHPDVLFLAEAFTRPHMMNALAKIGFSQSYTYFTWRNSKWELEEYLTELALTDVADYFRPNFFANTPDILHEYLQSGGPPAFAIRLVLAATLSPTYGIYSGFELFERSPREPGSEEYLDSEKYQLRHRDWDAEPSLTAMITRINEIRRKSPALGRLTNLSWQFTDNEQMIAFSKTHESESILVIVNLDPFRWQEATIHLDLDAIGVDPSQPFRVHDLLSDDVFMWHGPSNYVRLDPQSQVAHIFRVEV